MTDLLLSAPGISGRAGVRAIHRLDRANSLKGWGTPLQRLLPMAGALLATGHEQWRSSVRPQSRFATDWYGGNSGRSMPLATFMAD